MRRKLVWGELKDCMKTGNPVWGRVLNPCVGGYAVGVAGYVALLPSKQASIDNIQKIGALQQFYIHRMDEKWLRIELSNYANSSAKEDKQQGDGASAGFWSNIV